MKSLSLLWLLACGTEPLSPQSEPNTPLPEVCDDRSDNDWDGWVDCFDSDCFGDPACAEDCSDGSDNDQDGDADCWDSDCVGTPSCIEDCFDGQDNDKDQHTDCLDSDCADLAECQELCDDGLDNDQDGRIDCEDADCLGITPCIEVCDDGLDNDVDGASDCMDDECWLVGDCPGPLSIQIQGGQGYALEAGGASRYSGGGSTARWRVALEQVSGQATAQTQSGSLSCSWWAAELAFSQVWSAYLGGDWAVDALSWGSSGGCEGALAPVDFGIGHTFTHSSWPFQLGRAEHTFMRADEHPWLMGTGLYSTSQTWQSASWNGSRQKRYFQIQPGAVWTQEGVQ